MTASKPFGARSISLGLYAPDRADATAQEMIEHVVAQAVTADRSGFDGVTVSEHHAAFRTYFPNPILVTSWLLSEVQTAWGAPCPILLPLRSTGLVIEDVAWLAERYPGRVAAAVAPGYAVDDFTVAGTDYDDRRARYWSALSDVVRALSAGEAAGPLGLDQAVVARAADSVSVLSSAGGPVGARRAARAGAGIVPGSLEAPARVRSLFDEYMGAGGTGPRLIVRRVWVGDTKGALDRLLQKYHDTKGDNRFMQAVSTSEYVASSSHEEVISRLASAVIDSGAMALSIRIGLPDVSSNEVLEQIELVGREILPALRPALESIPLDPEGSTGGSK